MKRKKPERHEEAENESSATSYLKRLGRGRKTQWKEERDGGWYYFLEALRGETAKEEATNDVTAKGHRL